MGDELEELQQIADAADHAAADLGWMPTRTIVIQEVITPDGEREIAIAISRDLHKTDTLGMLAYATAVETAGITRDAIEGD